MSKKSFYEASQEVGHAFEDLKYELKKTKLYKICLRITIWNVETLNRILKRFMK